MKESGGLCHEEARQFAEDGKLVIVFPVIIDGEICLYTHHQEERRKPGLRPDEECAILISLTRHLKRKLARSGRGIKVPSL